jgi:hypothetical protein
MQRLQLFLVGGKPVIRLVIANDQFNDAVQLDLEKRRVLCLPASVEVE